MSAPQRYLLTPEQSSTTTLTCGGVDMLLAIDVEVRDAVPDTLLQAPSLLALVAVLDPCHTTCSVSQLTVTRPDAAGGVRVTVHEPGGEMVYAGTGSVSEDAVFFSLQSVAAPGAAPVAISCVLSRAGREVTEALSAAQVSPSAPKLKVTIDLDDLPIL